MSISLADICKIFAKYKVKFLIIGGDAAAYYGSDRVSLDYDLWIEKNEENCRNLVKALKELGYIKSINKKIIKNKKFYYLWEIIFKHKLNRFEGDRNRKPLDIFCGDIKYKKFEKCFKRVNIEKYRGIKFPFISKKDLIEMKKQAGRKKDYYDIESIKRYGKTL